VTLRRIVSVLILIALPACAGVKYASASNFATVKNRNDLNTLTDQIWKSRNGNIRLFARDLVKRGATCVEGFVNAKPDISRVNCAYFLCQASSLQQLTWRIGGESQISPGDESREAIGMPSTAYINYGWASPNHCRDLSTLGQKQRRFVLNSQTDLQPGFVEIEAD
jgi:hypothetical protein